MMETAVYHPKYPVRFVTASSLFDGHDASINIMRRILQGSGAEVIHLGHNRSVEEVVNAAIQEDVQGIAMSSYQGGHVEYFKYMYDCLRERGAAHIRIYGGGGGVIIPSEIKELHDYGIAKIFSPEDGRAVGLQGMINKMLQECDFPIIKDIPDNMLDRLKNRDPLAIARLISLFEHHVEASNETAAALDGLLEKVKKESSKAPVLGITGTGGAGKSSLTDELVRRF
jgi:isobutyryl-CoA mutase